MCAGACNYASSGLSVNSSNHSGRSRKRLSESRLPSLFLLSFGFLRVIRTTLAGVVRHFALELDMLKTNPVMSMLTTNCSQNWWITLEQQEVRSCAFCIHLSSLLWSTVVFDRWPTHKNIRGICRVFQAIEQLAFLRLIAQSRMNLDRERILVLPRLDALPHWLVSTKWGSWIFVNVSHSSEHNSFLLIMCIDAPESTANSRSCWTFRSGCRHYPCLNRNIKRSLVRILELVNICSPNPVLLCGRIFLGARSPFADLSPKFWSARTTLMKFTLLDNSWVDGPFLSRIFVWCQVPLENLTAFVFIPIPSLE